MSREESIQRLSAALTSTSDRYHGGFMSKPTWKSHMAALWAQVDRLGIRADVLQRVDPSQVGLSYRYPRPDRYPRPA